MNGLAALYEDAVDTHQSMGGVGAAAGIGTVHAAEIDAAGLSADRTLCDMATDDLLHVQGDIPTDSFDTWYPLGDHLKDKLCARCDKAAAGYH
ncbi:hypothetical protein V2S66_14440 [Streptomyces sp. V4-01]|uniref:Uncharacterized protein n=1 Tax=Actinacidiphila polyblastidii TaxID=3110430 RepID=A0ABU7PBW9_9ACTN|nr:hypothetical protein [Streptomyces sp. V4-01]